MKTERTAQHLEFQGIGRREVKADFEGGHVTSDGGALLLRETDKRFSICSRFAQCFTDYRKREQDKGRQLQVVRSVIGKRVGRGIRHRRLEADRGCFD